MEGKNPEVVLRAQGGRRLCRVLFSYDPQNDDELTLKVNDEIEFISEVEEGWWRGKLKGRVGVFPSNFVAMEKVPTKAAVEPEEKSATNQVPALPPKPVKEQCRVLFPYEAAVDDELTLEKDDIVTIITKDVEDKGWWKGELRGKIGLFPDNFVEIITPTVEPVPQKKPERPAKNLTEKSEEILANKDENKGLNTSSSSLGKETTEPSTEAEKPKNPDLNLIKADTVAAHKKNLEQKVLELIAVPPPIGKKPNLNPGVPRPLSQINQNWRLPEFPGRKVEKSGSGGDAADGAVTSKIAAKRTSLDLTKDVEVSDDLDLDIVSRSDMLNHITASRPKAPGRRPPSTTVSNRESEPSLTNGSSPPKETKWEKLRPPWVDELKINQLKSSEDSKVVKASSKTTIEEVKSSFKSITTKSVDNKKTTQSRHSLSNEIPLPAKQEEANNHISTASKISELSSMFSKVNENSNDSLMKKEVVELRLKVEKLEKLVADLAIQLKEETEKRRIIEKELNKLTDLVTQV